MGVLLTAVREGARRDGVTHFLFVQREGDEITAAALIPLSDLRHTFASWYMMNTGDLYELAKIMGHSNIKMTERYAKLGKEHIARTGSTAREMRRMMEPERREQIAGAV